MITTITKQKKGDDSRSYLCLLHETKLEKKTMTIDVIFFFSSRKKKHKKCDTLFATTPPHKKTTTHCHHLFLFKHREECNNIAIVTFLIKYRQEGDNIAIVAFLVAKQQQKKMKGESLP
jgi:hypothetical protein